MAVPVLKYVVGNGASTTSSSSVADSDTSIPLASTSNFDDAPVDGEGMLLIDEGESGEELAYSAERSGASLSIPLANRGLEGTSAAAHSSGATVKGVLTADMWNDVIAVLKEAFDQTTGKFAQLKDANGNEILKHVATGSAVNEVTITNSATNTP